MRVWVAFLASAVIAIVLVGRLALFMADVDRMHLSVIDRSFFRTHSCLSAYTEAARIAPTGANIFEVRQYADEPRPGEYVPRYLGPLEVDLYQYPPAFLVVPHLALRLGLDFFTTRHAWFWIQAAILLGAMVLLGRWVGGDYGATMLMLIPLVWIAPPTRLALQIGNFQVTAFPVAVAAMVAFGARHQAAGGFALGFVAASKIFPGVLGIVLLFQRRWGALAWTLAGVITVTAAAVATVGTAPFVDFLQYQLPRIESGAAFFWIEDPQMSAVNQSIYGLVTKLRVLGVPGTGQRAANAASSAYALVLVPIGVLAAVRLEALARSTSDQRLWRLRSAQVWLALLNLAAWRSPFVPDAYGMFGVLWLLTLIASEGPRRLVWIGLALAGGLFSLVLDGGAVPTPIPQWVAAATLAIQGLALAVNLNVAIRPARPLPRGRPTHPCGTARAFWSRAQWPL